MAAIRPLHGHNAAHLIVTIAPINSGFQFQIWDKLCSVLPEDMAGNEGGLLQRSAAATIVCPGQNLPIIARLVAGSSIENMAGKG